MGKDTEIQWSDSTLNLQMGCDGCELWKGNVRRCYAGRMIDGDGDTSRGFGGRKGWPATFGKPELFLDRLAPALKWQDLTHSKREEKPWMDTLPRIIFLNDMGDTFSAKLALNWLAPLLPLMAASAHQFLMLTKRPSRAAEFSSDHPFPKNFWLGTTITSNKTLGRIDQLMKIKGGSFRFLSVEPIWEDIDGGAYDGIDWTIFGGESGDDAPATDLKWLLNGIDRAREGGSRVFVKQLGSKPFFRATVEGAEANVPFATKDGHGGDWGEWPQLLQVREMPEMKIQPDSLL